LVKGVPKPTVAWYRNGNPINTDEIEPASGKPKNKITVSGDTQVASEFHLTHFNPKDADNVSKTIRLLDLKFSLYQYFPVFMYRFEHCG
jgi:hypothetical protein